MLSLRERLAEVEGAMAAACRQAGRPRGDVHLLAVSKTQPDEAVRELYGLGVRDFGENYVQELLGRRERLSDLRDARWHLIGPLQTNKVKSVMDAAASFHALDSEKLLHEIEKRSHGTPWLVFVQVNIDGEPTKSGIAPDDVPAFVTLARKSPAVRVEGLMAIPEPRHPIEAMRPAFQKLRALAAACGGAPLQLSMGMSEDFTVAIEEGAHWVRVGRRLFGERSPAFQG